MGAVVAVAVGSGVLVAVGSGSGVGATASVSVGSGRISVGASAVGSGTVCVAGSSVSAGICISLVAQAAGWFQERWSGSARHWSERPPHYLVQLWDNCMPTASNKPEEQELSFSSLLPSLFLCLDSCNN